MFKFLMFRFLNEINSLFPNYEPIEGYKVNESDSLDELEPEEQNTYKIIRCRIIQESEDSYIIESTLQCNENPEQFLYENVKEYSSAFGGFTEKRFNTYDHAYEAISKRIFDYSYNNRDYPYKGKKIIVKLTFPLKVMKELEINNGRIKY